MNTINADTAGRGKPSPSTNSAPSTTLVGVTYYNLIKAGKAPQQMKVGARRLISIEAAAGNGAGRWRPPKTEKRPTAR